MAPLDDVDMRRDALASWMGDRLAEADAAPIGTVEITDFEVPAVGQSNDTVLFTARWAEGSRRHHGEFVIRRQPSANQLFLYPDVVRESRVIAALENISNVPVPHVLWAEPDPSILGSAFFVMTRVRGTVPSGKPSIHTVGWLPTLSSDDRSHLWDSAMHCLVAIHDVDWPASHAFLVDDASAGDPESRRPPSGDGGHPFAPGLDGRLTWLTRWYRWATRGRPFPITDAALDHLIEHRRFVEHSDPVLVWGDARIGNMIFGSDLDVAAAIDWEVACIGPPELDMAHWLFFDEFAVLGAGGQRLEGLPDRATTIARYEALSGHSLVNLEYYEVIQGLFLAITLIRQADISVASGRLAEGTRMGHDNAVTQMLARRLGLPVPELASDYLAHRQIPTGPGGS